jgi:peptidoglycan hydrolase-like protein with peptidoglycan-binding domain
MSIDREDAARVNLSALPPSPDLYPWDKSAAVAELQELLRAHGFSLWIDGDFGWRTEVAVKAFQRQQGLRIDGIVGAKTWAALKSTVQPGTRILRRGLTGADVFELQGLLQIDGYSVVRDGFFGAETESAVVAFQREHQLREDGMVGSVTWTLLQGRKILALRRQPPAAKRNSLFPRF